MSWLSPFHYHGLHGVTFCLQTNVGIKLLLPTDATGTTAIWPIARVQKVEWVAVNAAGLASVLGCDTVSAEHVVLVRHKAKMFKFHARSLTAEMIYL
jgi:hypothetical protein